MRLLTSRMSRRHIQRFTMGTFLFLAVFSFTLPGNTEADQAAAAPPKKVKRLSVYDKVGDWKVQSLDGKELSFSACKGKVIFLNFWATWCKPCVEEMPDIAKLCETLKKEDVLFLLVSQEKDETVRNFLKKHDFDLPIYLAKQKPPKIFKTRQLPMTYLLDRDGGIAFRCTGITNWDDPAYQDLLRKLTKY